MNKLEQSIADFLSYIQEERGFSAYTVQAYRHDLHRFQAFLEQYDPDSLQTLSRIDRQTIRHFLGKEYEAGLSARTVARRLATLKSWCKFLLRTGQLQDNPSVHIRTPKVPKPLPDFLDETLVEKLMLTTDEKTFNGRLDRAVMELFYSTGMRLGELVNLNLGDVDWNQQVVKVHGKGNKERLIPFGERAKLAMDYYLKKRGKTAVQATANSPLFTNRKGRRIAPRTIQRHISKYFKKLATDRSYGPHILRHSFASHLLDRGADIRAVKEFLGHSSLSSTQIYTHIQPEKMKKIYQQAHPHGSK
jgi:tyrosine recombinase XerC